MPVKVIGICVGIGRNHGGLNVLGFSSALPGVESKHETDGINHGCGVIGSAIVCSLELIGHRDDFINGHLPLRRRK